MLSLKNDLKPKDPYQNLLKNDVVANYHDNPVKRASSMVMLVEDDKDNQQLIHTILKQKGYRVFSFDDALSALKFLEKNLVDIIVSDFIMPEMDGFEFCSIVKKKYENIYFIMITAKGDKQDVSNALIVGADDYIFKPFDITEFLARVKVGERTVQNQKHLVYLNEKLEKMADTDGLTRLKNRRFLINQGIKELNRAKRYHHTMAIMMIDIDNFKAINDSYGHLAGDHILKKVAKIIERRARDSDIVCRYGGEEFIVVLPETDPKKAFFTAEKIRKIVETTKTQYENKILSVTVSIGVAIKNPDVNISFNDFINLADKALYLAKRTGKNKSIIYKWFNTSSFNQEIEMI